jgi:hypothetical protein
VFAALKGGDFRETPFHPGNFDIPSTVDVDSQTQQGSRS